MGQTRPHALRNGKDCFLKVNIMNTTSTDQSRQSFRINENDLSPIDTVTLNNVNNFAFQVCLLLAKRLIERNVPLDDLFEQVKMELMQYNNKYLYGIISEPGIESMVSTVLFRTAQGRNNVGKMCADGVITLSVRAV